MIYKIIENHPNDSRVKYREDGVFQTLSSRMGTGGGNVPMVHCLNDQGGKVMDVSEEKTGTLRAEAHGHAPIVHTVAIEGNGSRPSHKGNGYKETDKMYTLNTTEVHGVAYSMGHDERSNQFVDEGKIVVGSLCAHDGRGFNGQDVEQNKVVYPAGKVRRLTPTECERLQGLPDGYTDIEFNGKPAPDSRRYKALGNGMAQPCADYVIRSIVEVLDGEGI